MPSRVNIIEGLKILEKYNPGGYCDARHDVLFGGEAYKVSDEDAAALDRLGWHVDSETDSWAAFT